MKFSGSPLCGVAVSSSMWSLSVAQQFAEGVAGGLARRRRPRHAVRLVDDDEIPMDLPQAGQNIVALGEVERGDDLRSFEELVDPELLAEIAALDDLELLVELLLQLALPLEGEVGRADDEDALDQAAQLQFPDEQPGHDRLAGAGVVGEQEADLGELQADGRRPPPAGAAADRRG